MKIKTDTMTLTVEDFPRRWNFDHKDKAVNRQRYLELMKYLDTLMREYSQSFRLEVLKRGKQGPMDAVILDIYDAKKPQWNRLAKTPDIQKG